MSFRIGSTPTTKDIAVNTPSMCVLTNSFNRAFDTGSLYFDTPVINSDPTGQSMHNGGSGIIIRTPGVYAVTFHCIKNPANNQQDSGYSGYFYWSMQIYLNHSRHGTIARCDSDGTYYEGVPEMYLGVVVDCLANDTFSLSCAEQVTYGPFGASNVYAGQANILLSAARLG